LFLFKNKKKRRVSIVPNKRLKIGYEIKPEFSIVGSKNPANYKLMELIHSFFNGIGSRRLLSFFLPLGLHTPIGLEKKKAQRV
jgi:hypothetical protein